nr:BMP family ABC transporter substrate-binding protein [Lysinibacter cavernae]
MNANASGATARRIVRTGVAIMVAAGMLAAAGCSARGSETGASSDASTTVKKFAIVTPEKEADHGWNQQGIWAAKDVATSLDIELDDNSNVGYDNTETILTQVADNGNDFIIAHASGFATVAARVAEATGVPTLVVDYEKNIPGTVASVTTEAQQGAYLAGVVAAKSTTTQKVGIVVSAEDLNWFRMSGGFAEGVYSVDPSIEVTIAYIGPAEYGDSAGGKNQASVLIAGGADVIIGMGDGATVGYLQAVETAPNVKYIATIGDVSEAVTNPDTVLTTVQWNFADTFTQAIKDVEDGSFGTATYSLTVENKGLTLQETDAFTDDITAAVKQATEDIASGKVTVTRATTKDQVQSIIDAKK